MMIKDVIEYNLFHFLSVIFSIVYYFTFVYPLAAKLFNGNFLPLEVVSR